MLVPIAFAAAAVTLNLRQQVGYPFRTPPLRTKPATTNCHVKYLKSTQPPRWLAQTENGRRAPIQDITG
jgi:hypothetical protein